MQNGRQRPAPQPVFGAQVRPSAHSARVDGQFVGAVQDQIPDRHVHDAQVPSVGQYAQTCPSLSEGQPLRSSGGVAGQFGAQVSALVRRKIPPRHATA